MLLGTLAGCVKITTQSSSMTWRLSKTGGSATATVAIRKGNFECAQSRELRILEIAEGNDMRQSQNVLQEPAPAVRREMVAELMPLADQTIRLNPNQAIYREGQQVLAFYQVEAGAVRIYRLMPDGRRHILSFCSKGDWFGLEQGCLRADFAEAVSESRIRPFATTPDAATTLNLLTIALANLAKAQSRHLAMIEQSALKRVATFIHEMAQRHPGELEFDILMCRNDVADYLGLTVETVARSFTKLRDRHIIRLKGTLQRSVQVIDEGALAALTA
jgi:CRP/FNR family nitrogen fixation transcriptional regulator